jgi:hypothetical protein
MSKRSMVVIGAVVIGAALVWLFGHALLNALVEMHHPHH